MIKIDGELVGFLSFVVALGVGLLAFASTGSGMAATGVAFLAFVFAVIIITAMANVLNE